MTELKMTTLKLTRNETLLIEAWLKSQQLGDRWARDLLDKLTAAQADEGTDPCLTSNKTDSPAK